MKRLLLSLCAGLWWCSLQAQVPIDLIVRRDGIEIAAHIIEVTPYRISYYRVFDPGGPLFTEPTAAVALARFANGTKQAFPVSDASVVVPGFLTDSLFYPPRYVTESTGPLKPIWFADSLATDPGAARFFEYGRRVAHAARALSRRPATEAPPLPGTPAGSPHVAARALIAYQDGYRRQLHREQATRSDRFGLAAGLVGGGVITGVLVATIISVFSGPGSVLPGFGHH